MWEISGQLTQSIKASSHSDEIKMAQCQIIHMINLRLFNDWCGCPRCKHYSTKILAHFAMLQLLKEKEEANEQKE